MKTVQINKILIISVLSLLVSSFTGSGKQPVFSAPASGASSFPDPCFTENTAFQPGEELTYKVYYNWGFVWLSAAEITFRVIDDDDQYHFQVVGETYDSYNWFFEVKDYFDSWVMKDNLLPIMSIKSLKEGKYNLYDYLTFDQSRSKIYNERGKAKDDIREHHNFEVESCMHDLVSIVYFARNVDFEQYQEGSGFPIKLFADKETWPLDVTYQGKEPNKKIKGTGRFNTLKFSPKLVDKDLFPNGSQAKVWLSDDANRVPLVIESPLTVGSVKVILKDYKGLRHELASKVK
ncbi:MAG TPA: DUF3108 domain-containing protein [Bacteroidetes bacterium]|nr:DUF3108 domain-containing protein [Bacteroidota bacterium]